MRTGTARCARWPGWPSCRPYALQHLRLGGPVTGRGPSPVQDRAEPGQGRGVGVRPPATPRPRPCPGPPSARVAHRCSRSCHLSHNSRPTSQRGTTAHSGPPSNHSRHPVHTTLADDHRHQRAVWTGKAARRIPTTLTRQPNGTVDVDAVVSPGPTACHKPAAGIPKPHPSPYTRGTGRGRQAERRNHSETRAPGPFRPGG
jgi:hypothetical protein